MKNYICAFAAILSMVSASSCEDDKCGSVNVYINGQESLNKSVEESGRLSVKEVCKLGYIYLTGGWDEANSWFEDGYSTPTYTGTTYQFKINPPADETFVGEIDTANCRLRFRPEVIEWFERERESHGFFRESFKFVITNAPLYLNTPRNGYDTVAYVPTAQRMAVVDELLELFNDKEENWDRICELFNEAFVFIPCTGEEYRALAAAGLN